MGWAVPKGKRPVDPKQPKWLHEPIWAEFVAPGLLSTLTSDTDDIDAINREKWLTAHNEQIRRLDLLADYLGVPENVTGHLRTILLCLKLAESSYRGMRIEFGSKPTKKRIWTPSAYFELMAAIEMIRRERGCGVREACKIKLQRDGKRATLNNIKTLEARFAEADKVKHNEWAKLLGPKDDAELRARAIGWVIEAFGQRPREG